MLPKRASSSRRCVRRLRRHRLRLGYIVLVWLAFGLTVLAVMLIRDGEHHPRPVGHVRSIGRPMTGVPAPGVAEATRQAFNAKLAVQYAQSDTVTPQFWKVYCYIKESSWFSCWGIELAASPPARCFRWNMVPQKKGLKVINWTPVGFCSTKAARSGRLLLTDETGGNSTDTH